jgi:hypothetical protein
MRKFIYGVGVGITLAFGVVFILNQNPPKNFDTTSSQIIVGQ